MIIKKSMRNYDKYKNHADIHWNWYYNNVKDYRVLVDESLAPFRGIDLGSVVDIGCGDGLPLSFIAQLGFRCTGVEPERQAVEYAVRHGVNGEYFIETAEKFAERKKKFDYLYSLNTIEHLTDPQALVEICRHIRRFSVIATDNAEASIDPSQYHKHEFTPAEFEKLFAEFDLQKLSLSSTSFFGYIVKNRKT